MSLAWIFPGQGSQKPEMGLDLYREEPEARELFLLADRVLEFPLSELIFQGPMERLSLTENLQPALLVVSTALVRLLRSGGAPEPSVVAGHSLGEYSALVAAGSLELADALRIVRLRGQLMQAAAPAGTGGMVALIGATGEQALKLCRDSSREGSVVVPANLNGAGQVVLSGHDDALARALEGAKEAGIRRAVRLPVSVPFHSPLMEEASAGFARHLAALPLKDPAIPLVRNCDARMVSTAEEVRHGLELQFHQPVLWESSMDTLGGLADTTLEIGPGKVLTNLVKRSIPGVRTRAVGDRDGVRQIVEGEI